MSALHHEIDPPSEWVRRWAGLIPADGRVLDVACGRGRHLRYLRALGLSAVGVDRDSAALDGLAGIAGIELRVADIESAPWPFLPESFDAVVVTNYLHRPLFPALVGALRPGGALIYETFAVGNERYGRPGNPEFLLRSGELLARVEPLRVVAFEQGLISLPKPAIVQRICAVRGEEGSAPLVSG
jgi:SAM-dependent methyltransferase